MLAQTLSQPHALALVCGDEALTRLQFAALIDAAATQLRDEGHGAGAFIGWLGLNSPQMLATLFACSRLGAVFVPLNWRLVPLELAAIARHAGLSTLKCSPEMAGLADAVTHIGIGRMPPAPAQSGDVMLAYTSGTTGQPKGAMHTQASMLANVAAALAVQGLSESDRVLSVLPMFHVGGLCIQTLPALLTGAVVRLHARFDPGTWLDDVAHWRPSTSLLVPAVMRALIEHPGFAGADLSSLRFVNSGSSVVPLPLIEAFHARGVPVTQVYGSTESGPVSIALLPDEARAHPGRVGRAAPGVQMRLVSARPADASQMDACHADAQGAEVMPGQVGEIHLRAANLMRGYHREPAGAGFVDGWFATGDLARVDAHGHCEVVGRVKDMIISGGENIDPTEIENLVAGWPGVAEAAVLGLPDARWGEVPVLVLTTLAGAVIDLEALQGHFRSHLARFKHPRRIELLDELPRTALGKVKKAVLRERLSQGT